MQRQDGNCADDLSWRTQCVTQCVTHLGCADSTVTWTRGRRALRELHGLLDVCSVLLVRGLSLDGVARGRYTARTIPPVATLLMV